MSKKTKLWTAIRIWNYKLGCIDRYDTFPFHFYLVSGSEFKGLYRIDLPSRIGVRGTQ